MVAIIKYAKFVKKGERTAKSFKYRFASKWKIARPKAKDDLFMLYGIEGQFICTVTAALLRKARRVYRNEIADKTFKGGEK